MVVDSVFLLTIRQPRRGQSTCQCARSHLRTLRCLVADREKAHWHIAEPATPNLSRVSPRHSTLGRTGSLARELVWLENRGFRTFSVPATGAGVPTSPTLGELGERPSRPRLANGPYTIEREGSVGINRCPARAFPFRQVASWPSQHGVQARAGQLPPRKGASGRRGGLALGRREPQAHAPSSARASIGSSMSERSAARNGISVGSSSGC